MKNIEETPAQLSLIASRFKALIRAERITHGLSMRQAAEACGMKSPQLWEAYEVGRREPTITQAVRMLNVFGLGVEFR